MPIGYTDINIDDLSEKEFQGRLLFSANFAKRANKRQ